MTRIATPRAHQHALNARDQAARLAAALNGSCTADGLVAAERSRKQAMLELIALGGLLRSARARVREQDREAEKDKRIIERDALVREVMA